MRIAVLLVLGLAALAAAWALARDDRPASGGDGRITLFHETHTHGELTRFPSYVGVRKALAESGGPSLFLGNGDDVSTFFGDVYTDGRHTIEAFNAAGLDADTFGFSEMEFSLDRLRELVAASRFAWVSANVLEGDDVLAADQGARRWAIEEVGGVRVGLTGVLGTRFTHDQPPRTRYGQNGEVQVLDPARALSAVVPEMREAGADVVVVLSHMIHEDTLRVVDVVPGIDVALGSHLGPPTLRPDRVGRTIVAVAGPADLEALGVLELTVRDGRVVSHMFRRRVPSSADPVDRAVEAALARYR